MAPAVNYSVSCSAGLVLPKKIRKELRATDSWFSSLSWNDFFVLHWRDIGAFAVRNDGLEILYSLEAGTPKSVFRAYLYNQALSMALLRQGQDTLHGVACEWNGCGLLFLGASGFGKSTLLTGLLRWGARFVSDDLLILEQREKDYYIRRGFAHMKLYPDAVAKAELEFVEQAPLNPYTDKVLCALDASLVSSRAALPVERVFVLQQEPCDEIVIESLTGIKKFESLASNVFNSLEASKERRITNLRTLAGWSRLPVFSLRYPRRFEKLGEVVHEVMEYSF